MILPPNTVSGPRGRALATRKPVRIQPGRQRTVRVNALFGFGGGSSGGSNEAVLELVNSKFRGPSEAGNEAVAEAVRPFNQYFISLSCLYQALQSSMARAGVSGSG